MNLHPVKLGLSQCSSSAHPTLHALHPSVGGPYDIRVVFGKGRLVEWLDYRLVNGTSSEGTILFWRISRLTLSAYCRFSPPWIPTAPPSLSMAVEVMAAIAVAEFKTLAHGYYLEGQGWPLKHMRLR